MKPGVLTLVPDIFHELRTSLGSVTGLSELVSNCRRERHGVWGRGRKWSLASLASILTRQIIFENTFYCQSHGFPNCNMRMSIPV